MRNTARQTRDNRTITVDFHDEATYVQLLDDRQALVEFVLAFLSSLLAFNSRIRRPVAAAGA